MSEDEALDALAELVTDLQNALTQSWVPLELTAALVRTDDLLVQRKGPPLQVIQAGPLPTGKIGVLVHKGGAVKGWELAPTYALEILVPHTERASLLELRRQLNDTGTMQTLDRTDTPGSTT
jgi:hypothetical protein